MKGRIWKFCISNIKRILEDCSLHLPWNGLASERKVLFSFVFSFYTPLKPNWTSCSVNFPPSCTTLRSSARRWLHASGVFHLAVLLTTSTDLQPVPSPCCVIEDPYRSPLFLFQVSRGSTIWCFHMYNIMFKQGSVWNRESAKPTKILIDTD